MQTTRTYNEHMHYAIKYVFGNNFLCDQAFNSMKGFRERSGTNEHFRGGCMWIVTIVTDAYVKLLLK
jgi:hypothetical protein